MPTPFSDLKIRRAVVHEVFPRDNDRTPVSPRCSTHLAEIDRDGVRVIRDRLVRAIGSDARRMEMVVTNSGPGSAFSLVDGLREAEDEKFVELSQQLTLKLDSVQGSRTIPGGVVVVMDGVIGEEAKPFGCIIKAEMHDGFLKEMSDSGPLIRYLRELLLTPNQKFHKVGLFIRDQLAAEEGFEAEAYRVFVFDAQMSGADPRTAANYFYEMFLGCAVAPNSSRLTRRFYEASKAFINSAVDGDDKKVELVTALHVYLRSERQTIHAGEFAEEYLPGSLHQGYRDAIREADVPDTAIYRDTSLIKRKLKIRNLRFSNDVRLIAPADRFDELVQVVDGDTDEWTNVRIRGHIQKQD
jgi:hypothetical protein